MELSVATIEDAKAIMELTNEAYAIVEDGSTGSKFKKGPRLSSPTEGKLFAGYQEGRIFKVIDLESGKIVGMTYWEVTSQDTLYFGPFAVSPDFQGRKVGTLMLAEVERIARERKLIGIDINVVHLRPNLVSWYKDQGYVQTGTSPYPVDDLHNTTQPVHFIEMRRLLHYDKGTIRDYVLATAVEEDAGEIMNVINDAYEEEIGDTGMKFKKVKRILHPTEGKLLSAYREGRILKAVHISSGCIVGVVNWELTAEKTLYFGPLAVSPAFQGKRIGKLLLTEVERIAREHHLIGIDIKVIHLRTDLVAWYMSQGYVQTGTSPYPPENMYKITQPVHFIDLRRPLRQKATVDEFELQKAVLEDAVEIMNLINDAYGCENGSTGFWHKKERRVVHPTEGDLLLGYEEGRIIKVVQTSTGLIVGMTYWEVTGESSLYFGPFAVNPAFQGRRIGKMMLDEVERIAKERNLKEIKIVVVNLRTDLISMYKHMGFVQTGTAPFPSHAVYKLTRTDLHIIEMCRSLASPSTDQQGESDITGPSMVESPMTH